MAKRSAEDAGRTRDDIVRAARKAFAAKGYGETSTAEVARAANVTEGAFFHHFGSKKALFAEIVEALEQELTAHAVATGLEGPPLDAFLKACRGSLEYAQRRDYQQIVMIDGPNVLGDSEWRRVDSGFGLSTIRAGLKRIDAGKRLSERERRMLAVAVLGILNEASFALAREERGVSIDGCVDLVRRLIAMSLAG